MENLHTEISHTGDRPLVQESRYFTPQSSPFQQHADSQHKAHFSPRNDSSHIFQIQGSSVAAKGQKASCLQDSSIHQPSSHQEQQVSFERSLRPLLPKVAKFEVPSSMSSPYLGVSGFVNTAQPHDQANAGGHQIQTSHEHCHIQSPQRDITWLNTEEISYQNPYIPPPLPPSRWIQAREYRRRVYEPPYHDANSDPTIAEVQRDAEFWVSQLELAITNVQTVKDTEGSHAKRMFLPGSYDRYLIEASCRQVFATLVDRCKSGFRGPTQFNKALKPGKDCDADRTAKCEERMRNVIQALTWNKRVCKDVLYEDWKILLLVNHPLAYDKEKDNQKGSNDQRRARQQSERDKLKRTEEELLAYRQVNRQVNQQGPTSRMDYNTMTSTYPFFGSAPWVGDQNVEQTGKGEGEEGYGRTEDESLSFNTKRGGEGLESKRAYVEEEEGTCVINAKRPRFG